jgi:multidrug efflux pump subunit AcrB
MNKLFLALLICLIVGAGLISCKKNQTSNTCFYLEKAPVVAIEGATTAQVGQEITLRISFTCKNGCGDFDNFSTVSSGNVSTITVTARYTGCICTKDIPTRVALYKFKATQTGRYDLQFLQSGTAVVTHSIVVQ